MGIQDLQTLFESEGVDVDLFKIGRNHAGGFRLVLDAEGCLDRLYGGFFSDWACGGQWARCVQFLTTLASALCEHGVTICVCLDGSHPSPPMPLSHWAQQQAANRQKINNVLRHIAVKGTPPPKVWWVPPTGLHSCLRTALRYLNIPLMVSSDDHYQEVVGLCREKGFAGIIGNAPEYLIFQPPRLFSSSTLKLTYRSSLESKEYMVHELARYLKVQPERTCIVAALLGSNFLPDHSLNDFYKKIGNPAGKKTPPEQLIKSVAAFVQDLQSTDFDDVTQQVFGDQNDLRIVKFKQAIQYFFNGTKEGYLKYKIDRRTKSKKNENKNESNEKQTDLDTSKLATEDNEKQGLMDYQLATQNSSMNADPMMKMDDYSLTASAPLANNTQSASPPEVPLENSPESTTSNTSTAVNKETKSKKGASNRPVQIEDTCPSPPAEISRTCAERHAKGLMQPALLSILTHRHITLPVVMEDEMHRELPSIHHFYRPIRQNVYAILYNMHHHKFMATKAKESEKGAATAAPAQNAAAVAPHTVYVSEWIYTRQNQGKTPEIVPGVLLEWPVPTVQRLWFGTAADDKCRRLRAFLSCMRSDTPLMLNTSYVPQHLLILATVLRYIMSSQIQVLRRQELDAFLATAFSPELMNALQLQEMNVGAISCRGVQLAALIAAGAETALLANDACGAPVPWLVAAPWLYSDGKLLQKALAKAHRAKHLMQLCEGQVEIVMKVERIRKAILEGLDVEFALPPLMYGRQNMAQQQSHNRSSGPMGGRHHAPHYNPHATARLEIAGVVVGQWGAGAPMRGPRYSIGGGNQQRRRRRVPRPTQQPNRQNSNAQRDAPAKSITLTVNGKTVRSDDACVGDGDEEKGTKAGGSNAGQQKGKAKRNGNRNRRKSSVKTDTDNEKDAINGVPPINTEVGQGDSIIVAN